MAETGLKKDLKMQKIVEIFDRIENLNSVRQSEHVGGRPSQRIGELGNDESANPNVETGLGLVRKNSSLYGKRESEHELDNNRYEPDGANLYPTRLANVSPRSTSLGISAERIPVYQSRSREKSPTLLMSKDESFTPILNKDNKSSVSEDAFAKDQDKTINQAGNQPVNLAEELEDQDAKDDIT